VIFDPWNGFSPGERFVNDAEASLMSAGALIAREMACTVRYTGHQAKAVARGGIIDAHSGRGGSAMGDNARFCFSYALHDPKEEKSWKAPSSAAQAAARGDLYRLHMTKQSYAKRLLEPIWIEREGYTFTVHEGAPTTPQTVLFDDGERVKRFVAEELERNIRYSAERLTEQRERFAMSRGKARQVIAWLQSNGGLVEKPLPDGERRTRATHYLEPVFPQAKPESPHGTCASDLFE
jgi:RecA-family ATPase